MAANDYAVIVGITEYPSLGNLKGPENDASSFCEWLTSPEGGCVPAENISLLVSSVCYNPVENDPLKAEPGTGLVDAAFERLINQVPQGGSVGRRLYIFLAGHGFGPEIEEAALLMANASRLGTGHHIPGRLYAKWFRTSALFDEVVLFMDTCRDDYRRPPIHFPPWIDMREPEGANSRYFFGFATRWSRKAREQAIPPGGPFHGVFTHALLTALRSAPANAAGQVTGDAVINYIYNVLPRLVTGDEYQEPDFQYDKYHDIIFAERAVSAKTKVRLVFHAPDPDHGVEIFDHDFQVVESLPAVPANWEVSLSPGRYLVQIASTGQRKAITVIGEEVIYATL